MSRGTLRRENGVGLARDAQLLGECLDHGRIELRPRAAFELGKRFSLRYRRVIRPFGRHRVVGVGDEDDPCAEWDLVARETVRIAGAVPALVVMEDRSED